MGFPSFSHFAQAQEEKAKLQKRRERQKSDASDVTWRGRFWEFNMI